MQYSSRYLLLLLFFSLYSLSYSISYLNRHGSYTYYTHTSQFYLDLGEFEKDDYIYFKVKVEYGYFSNYYMRYGGFYTYPSSDQALTKSEYYYSYSSGSYYSGSYYYSYALYYSIPKPSAKYLVVETPYINLYSYGFAYISNEGGLSTGAIIGICAAVIVAIAIASVVTYFVRRARRASYISPPVAVYAPPVTPPPTYY